MGKAKSDLVSRGLILVSFWKVILSGKNLELQNDNIWKQSGYYQGERWPVAKTG